MTAILEWIMRLFRWPISEREGQPIPQPEFGPGDSTRQEQLNQLAQRRVDSEARKARVHRGFPPCPGNAYDRRQYRRKYDHC